MAEEKGFFENKSKMLGTALVLILISFFLLNYGVRGIAWAYWLGLLMLVAGMILAPLTRFTAEKKDESEESGEGQGGPGKDAEESPGKEEGE